jgi:beta-lactamase regulating signal transducer with metallopeptidase domain
MDEIIIDVIITIGIGIGIFFLTKNVVNRKKNSKKIWWMVTIDALAFVFFLSSFPAIFTSINTYNSPAMQAQRLSAKNAKLAALASQKAQSELEAKYGDAMSAYSASQEIVKKHLKAPSTAKFPSFDEARTSLDSATGIWTVECYVDSQNSFSAVIRGYYSVKIRISGKDSENTNWEDLSFSMN